MGRRGVVALSGHNLRAVVALARWAAGAGVPLHLAARDAADGIYLTRHADRVFTQRRSPQLSVAEIAGWIGQLCEQHRYERVVIAPSTEFFNRFLLRHRAEIEAAGGIVPLVDEALYERISDKEAFAALCAEHGLPVPAVFDTLPERLPFVAKPRRYAGGSGLQVKPYLVLTEADREKFLRREAPDDFFFQEFVQGQSLYLLAHIGRNGQVTASAQENLIQQAEGGSIVLARAHEFHREPEARRYLAMLIEAGFHGLVMIEVRRCRRTGHAVMIEANPRLWGPLQFMLDRGADALSPLFAECGIERQAPAPAQPERPYYFWSGGLARSAPWCVFHEGWSPQAFVQDHRRIAECDLFARDDSLALYRHELAAD